MIPSVPEMNAITNERFNPRITHREGTTISAGQGCKSAPDLRLDIERSAIIDIAGMDETGAPVLFRAEGFEAIVLQHEMDHLEGKLITHQLAPEECASYERRLANIVRREREPWYVSNLEEAAPCKRLWSVALQPEGVLFSQRKANYQVFVVKDGSQIQLYFSESRSDVKDINVSGIMSRVDIDSPLNLLGIYTQAMMLSLLWKAEPHRVYVSGFGGGRQSMVLIITIRSWCSSPRRLTRLSSRSPSRYFGIELDNRMQVFVMDGREYLMKLSSDDHYDIMLVDCYTGSGAHPYSVSTMEFYELCKSHLAEDGVVASNLVRSDPMFREKMHTFVSSFSHAWRFELGGADVFFGSDLELSMAEMFGKADELYERFKLPFSPLRGLVKNLRPIKSEETSLGPTRDCLIRPSGISWVKGCPSMIRSSMGRNVTIRVPVGRARSLSGVTVVDGVVRADCQLSRVFLGAPGSSVASGAGLEPGAPRGGHWCRTTNI